MRILGITGSLREGSFNTALLATAAELAPGKSQVLTWDGLSTVPPFNEDCEGDPGPAVEDLRARIADADAVLICTPEYNGSIPGQLKNALDWASRPFPGHVLEGKPIAVIGASPGPGGAARAAAETRLVCERLGALVVPEELPLPAAHEHVGTGVVTDDGHRTELRKLLDALSAVVTPGEAR